MNVGKLGQDIKAKESWWSRIAFLKSFGVAKLLLFVHGLLQGLINCLLDWMGREMFQVLLARSSL